MKTNETDLLMKTEMCNTLGSLRRLVLVLEQFHDWFLLKLPVKYYPEKVSQKRPSVGYSWIFHYWGTPYTCMGCFSEVFWEEKIFLDIVSQKQIYCDLCTYFASCKVKRTVGRFQLEAPRAYQCKQILGPCQTNRSNKYSSFIHAPSDNWLLTQLHKLKNVQLASLLSSFVEKLCSLLPCFSSTTSTLSGQLSKVTWPFWSWLLL